MENIIGKWGGTNLYNILLTNDTESVHPEDWSILKNYKYIRSIHQCTGKDANYIYVTFYDKEIRIRENIFYPLDVAPEFKPLEKVQLENSKGAIEFGIIKGIYWHNNNHKFYYDVEVNNKIKGRRYYAKDLQNSTI